MPALARLATLSPWTAADDDDPVPVTTEVATTLPVGAATAFAAFADIAQTPRWLSVVQSARIVRADAAGRPRQVAFLARLERATIGYTLAYAWDPAALTVAWSTPAGASVHIAGEALFQPLAARACLLHYRLALRVPFDGDWANASFAGNAAAAVASEFREHLRRLA